MSYISRWLLLVPVILQISSHNLEAILYSGHFFYTPCILNKILIVKQFKYSLIKLNELDEKNLCILHCTIFT